MCQPTSEDIKHYLKKKKKKKKESRAQEVCESRGGRPGLSLLTSLIVSVDVKQY